MSKEDKIRRARERRKGRPTTADLVVVLRRLAGAYPTPEGWEETAAACRLAADRLEALDDVLGRFRREEEG